MTVDPKTAAAHVDYLGRRFYFCNVGCSKKFRMHPQKYLEAENFSTPEVPSTQTYTCPMHPEIVRSEPGSCPICGMALEAKLPSAIEDNAELKDMSRRFWVSVALSLPLVILEMSGMLGGAVPAQHLSWIELALATPVVLWAGWPFFTRGWQSITSRRLNMFTLIAIGVATAYLYSVAAVLLPDLFRSGFTRC